MFTCKQVSKALHEEDYSQMSPLRRFFLRLHLRLCVVCGKYNKQVIESQDMCTCYKQYEAENEADRPKLDLSQKEALKELLADKIAK